MKATTPVGPPQLDELLGQIATAKLDAADLYDACLALAAPGPTSARLRPLPAEERHQARLITTLRGDQDMPTPLSTMPQPEISRFDSGLMLAFALDQAATAALVGLKTSPHPRVAALVEDVLATEKDHQRIVVDELASLARPHPEIGRRLAREMIEARDWIKEAFPRRNRINALAAAGFLPADAAPAHDAFLASLGDRIQEALGVLGEM